MGQGASIIDSETRRFAFAGVELDAATHTMRVDGVPVSCSRKAFDLLLQLCLIPERVQTRDELIEALWPGGQVVSDEALTQVIFRARAVLGRYANHLLTVRGVGLRIDAEVRALERVTAPSASPILQSLTINTPLRRASDAQRAATREPVEVPADPLLLTVGARALPEQRPTWRLWWLIAAMIAVLAIAAGARFVGNQDAIVDEGYGLLDADLHAEQAGTAEMIREAFLNDARGERARGQALLKAVQEADAQTPVPAIFIALWAAGAGDAEQSQIWLKLARQRVGGSRDVYLNLLLEYVQAEVDGDGADVIRQAGAILDIRPNAWRMHSARSHLMVASGMREAALHEVQQIEVPALGHRKLEMVIADRASMGDIAGAQAMLDRLPKGDDAAAYAFLNGRIAWSRGDFEAAHRHFSEAAAKGFESARADLLKRALVNLAAIEVLRNNDEAAIADLERARVGMSEAGNRIDEIDTSLFLAELHARAGQSKLMQVEVQRALSISAETNASGMRFVAALIAKRLRPELDLAAPTDMPAEAEALWRARAAFNQGDRVAAAAALTDARHRGVLDTRLAEEARFLAWQLGQEVSPEQPIDPPYPPLALFVLRRDLRNAPVKASP